MTSIVSYRKVTDAYTTHSLVMPDGCTELATIEGLTYVSVPDGAALSATQPAGVEAQLVKLSNALLQTLLRASTHAQLIDARRAAKIAQGATSATADAAAATQLAALGLQADTALDAADQKLQMDAAASKADAKVQAITNMTPAQIRIWVETNVTNLAQAKDAIATLGVAVSVLARKVL